MHLESLRLQNFRSFVEAEVPLRPDLTVLVGENNGGKSNAIDAIRLLTMPLAGRREIYCETTDIRLGSSSQRFELQGTLSDLKPAQQGRFLSAAADSSLETAVLGLAYDEDSGTFPFRPSLWAGHQKGVPEPGCLQMVRHVYLPPLRDAKRALASGNPTRIYALLRHLLGDDDPDELAKSLGRDTSAKILERVDNAVDIGLAALTKGVRRQSASLGFAADERLIDIARDLRFKLADSGIAPEELRYSGHGYASLLYMATIAVELENVDNADLTLFLVEEPEAHLHPQLQAAVLSFLEDQVAASKKLEPGYHGPAGEVQVVVATHSPNLSAWVKAKKLVVFKSTVETVQQGGSQLDPEAEDVEESSDGDEGGAGGSPNAPESPATDCPEGGVHEPANKTEADGGSDPPVASSNEARAESTPDGSGEIAPPRRESRCVPLSALGLEPIQWRKVDRYLDVTKSALLFGGRVLLVEGIAEALLLPVIARRLVLRNRLDHLRLFRSTVFVPIDGVDFEPYVRLLLTPCSGVRIADKVVVVTDGDGAGLEEGDLSPGMRRKTALDTVASDLGAGDMLHVVTSRYSLESELVLAGNTALLKRVYLQMHPRSEGRWDAAVGQGLETSTTAIQGLFESTRKGDFAQILAERIDEDYDRFTTPDYLSAAIEALVG